MKISELKAEAEFTRWLDKQGLDNKQIATIINDRRKAIAELKKSVKIMEVEHG